MNFAAFTGNQATQALSSQYLTSDDPLTPAEQKIAAEYTKRGFIVSKVNGQLSFKKDPNFKAPNNPNPVPGQATAVLPTSNKPTSANRIPLPDFKDKNSRLKYAQAFRNKYGKNVLTGYGDIPLRVNEKPVYGSDTSKNLITKAAQSVGLDPALLYSSAMIEGQSGLYVGAGKDANGQDGWRGYTGDKDFPISGLWGFGLDSFQDYYPGLVKKGYLPKDFDKQFKVWEGEGGPEGSTSGSESVMFKNTDSGVQAKAAMMKAFYDEFDDYTKKKKINLTPEQRDFFALAHFNSGAHGYEMLDSYNKAGLLKDNKFLSEMPDIDVSYMYNGKKMSKEASQKLHKQIYGNVSPRLIAARGLKEEGLFDIGGEVGYVRKGDFLPKAELGFFGGQGAQNVDPVTGFEGFKPTLQLSAPTVQTAQIGSIDTSKFMPATIRPSIAINPAGPVPKQKKQFAGYDTKYADTALEIMSFAGNALEQKDKIDYAKWVRDRGLSDNSNPIVQSNRGDYTVNEGYFRPDQYTPVQFGSVPRYELGGAMFSEPMAAPPLETPSEMMIQGFSAPTESAPNQTALFSKQQFLTDGSSRSDEEDSVAVPTSDHFRQFIINKESQGNYKALPRKKDGSLASSAVGAYQFLWNTHKDAIKNITGVTSKEEFRNNPEAQDAYFDYWDANILTPEAQKLRKYAKDVPFDVIKSKVHFAGPKGAFNFYAKGKETKDAFGTTTSKYRNGGEYSVSPEELRQILAAGGEVEFV